MEHDVIAPGRTTALAVDALVRIIRAHIDFDLRHRHLPLSAFAPAPRPYRDAFERGPHHRIFEDTPGFAARMQTVIDVAVVERDPAIREFAPVTRIA